VGDEVGVADAVAGGVEAGVTVDVVWVGRAGCPGWPTEGVAGVTGVAAAVAEEAGTADAPGAGPSTVGVWVAVEVGTGGVPIGSPVVGVVGVACRAGAASATPVSSDSKPRLLASASRPVSRTNARRVIRRAEQRNSLDIWCITVCASPLPARTTRDLAQWCTRSPERAGTRERSGYPEPDRLRHGVTRPRG
jgi:hypothetical protein